MTILESLTEDMKTAMKASDKASLSAIRMLISAIKYAMVDTPNISEEAVIAVLTKEAKKRRESVLAYRNAGREELAKSEEFELSVISKYLPKMMSEEEVRAKLATLDLKGKQIGEAMKLAMAATKGQADGGVVSSIVKEIMSFQ